MKKSAFTLVELSIVLVIIGLLVGGSFKVLKIMRDRAQISRAQDDVKVAKEAVIGNAILNGNTLPDPDFFKKNLSPVKDNQHPLFYADDANLQKTDICAFSSTNLKVVTPVKTVNNVAFVVASEGANHNMQTALKDDGDGNFSVHTYTYATKVDDNTSPVNIADNYDDITDWVTLAQLQKELQCSSKPFAFINQSLPTAEVNEAYNATLYVENNVTDVNIACKPDKDIGITFSDPSFSGKPNQAITNSWYCTAREKSPSTRTVTKHYVITVNRAAANQGGNNVNGGGIGAGIGARIGTGMSQKFSH